MFKAILALLLCLVFGFALPVAAQTAHYRAALDSLTAEPEAVRRQGHCNGFGVSIVTQQGAVCQYGYGFGNVAAQKAYDLHTVQPIASVSKTVVSLALLKAQELGLLNWTTLGASTCPSRMSTRCSRRYLLRCASWQLIWLAFATTTFT